MKKIKQPLSKGYQIKRVVSTTPHHKAGDRQYNKNHYPNGIVSFIFLLLFYVIFFCTVLGVGFGQHTLGSQWWLNSLLGSGVGYFGLNLLWVIGRSGLFEMGGYGLVKFMRMIHLDIIKEKVEFYIHEPALNDVNNVSEYKLYCQQRRSYTKKWTYISLLTSAAVFVVTLVLYFSLFYSL